MFVFDSAGRYSVRLTNPDRTPDRGNYVAMFGTYVVVDDRCVFILTPRGAADPQLLGTEILRHVAFEGELAVFKTPITQVDGIDVTTCITWRRLTSR